MTDKALTRSRSAITVSAMPTLIQLSDALPEMFVNGMTATVPESTGTPTSDSGSALCAEAAVGAAAEMATMHTTMQRARAAPRHSD